MTQAKLLATHHKLGALSVSLGMHEGWLTHWLATHPGQEPPGMFVQRNANGRVLWVRTTEAFHQWFRDCVRRPQKGVAQ